MAKNKLLQEEIKKFKMLSEYSFYIPDEDLIEEDDEEIGDEAEAEGGEGDMPEPEVEGGEEPDLAFDGEEVDPEMGDEEMEPEMGGEDMEDLPEPEGDINIPGDEEEGDMDLGMEDMEDEGEEEIELDVTELVDKSEEAVESSEEANEKLTMLMQKFAELEGRIPKMDMLGKQLEDLKKDIAKRNPLEVEKLEMRSLNSYPYNIKLTDYWEDKDDSNYEVHDGEGKTVKKDEEYVLTKDDVNSDYSEMSVKDTFDYTEEDI